MSKKIMSESQVKEVLNIDSFRNLSKDKIMEFVSLIPNMDVDVAMSIIDKFPNFTEMAEHIVEQLGVTCDNAIIENSSSQRDVYTAYRKILDDLGEILKRENITPEERDSISNKMIEIADKIAEKDSENKNYLAWIVKNKTQVVSGVLLLGVAILGANIKGIDIPKLLK